MIGIVGGGITGLALAHRLAAAGVAHTLFESSPNPGGVIATRDLDGLPLELGPQRTRLTPLVRELVDELGLQDQLITSAAHLPLFVYRKGRLRRVPLSPRSALTTDLIPVLAKLRMLAEPLLGGPKPAESVAAYFQRKVGKDLYQALVGPLFGGLYASDPSRMLVRHALEPTLERLGIRRSLLWAWMRAARKAPAPACSFRDGMRILPEALAWANRANVRLGTHVTRIVRDTQSGFRIIAEGGAIPVKHVVMTVPAPAAADLLRGVAADAADRLGRLNYNRLAMVYLESDAPLEGFGYQVALGESLETRGVTWNTSLFGRSRLSTAFLGGMKNPAIVSTTDENLAEVAEKEFFHVVGMEARTLHVHRTWMPAWDRSWTHLDDLEVPDGITICSNYTSRPGIVGRLAEAKRLASHLAAEAA